MPRGLSQLTGGSCWRKRNRSAKGPFRSSVRGHRHVSGMATPSCGLFGDCHYTRRGRFGCLRVVREGRGNRPRREALTPLPHRERSDHAATRPAPLGFCPAPRRVPETAPGQAKNAIPRHQRRQLVLLHPNRREDGRNSKAQVHVERFASHSTRWVRSIWGIQD